MNLERENLEIFLSSDVSQLTVDQIFYLHSKLQVEILKDSVCAYENLLKLQIKKLVEAQKTLDCAEKTLNRGG